MRIRKVTGIRSRPTWKGSALLLFTPILVVALLLALGAMPRHGKPAPRVEGIATPDFPIPLSMLIVKGGGPDPIAVPDVPQPQAAPRAALAQNSQAPKPGLQGHPGRTDQLVSDPVTPRVELNAPSRLLPAKPQPFVASAEKGLPGNGPAEGSDLVSFDAAIGPEDLAKMEEMGQVALLAFMPNKECWRRWRVADGWTWMQVRDERTELQGMSNTCIPLILGLGERRSELARCAGPDKAAVADIQVGLSSHAVAVIRAAQALALGPATSGSPQGGARTIGRLVVNSGEIAFVIDATTGPARR